MALSNKQTRRSYSQRRAIGIPTQVKPISGQVIQSKRKINLRSDPRATMAKRTHSKKSQLSKYLLTGDSVEEITSKEVEGRSAIF